MPAAGAERRVRHNLAERRFALIVLLALLVLDGVIVGATMIGWHAMVPDFFAFWSTARYLQDHAAAQVYDAAALGHFQQQLLPRFDSAYPAPYSPIFLLAIRPLAWLPYGAAYLAWIGLTATAFLLAAWHLLPRPGWLAALCLSPAVLLCGVYGQTGFLTAALLLAAIAFMRNRPGMAGLCLALLAFKPQLGLLLPLMLLARRDARTIAATLIWLAILIALTSLLLGGRIWWDWLAALSAHGALVETARDHLLPLMASVTAGVRRLGMPAVFAHATQLAAALWAAFVVWRGWRHAPADLAIAATLVGGFLATPYAFTYDLPAAMLGALLFVQARRRDGGNLTTLELAATMFAVLAPLSLLTDTAAIPAVPLSLLALFAVIARRISRSAPSGSTLHAA